MAKVNDERRAPPARLAAREPHEQLRRKAFAQNNDRAVNRRERGCRFADVVYKRGGKQLWLGVALSAQSPHHLQTVVLVGDAHSAEKLLRTRRQNLVGLAQIVG